MRACVKSLPQTAVKALVINGDHLNDVESLVRRIQRTLPEEGGVLDVANINRFREIEASIKFDFKSLLEMF